MGRVLLTGWGALVVRCPIVVMCRTKSLKGASRAGTLWPRARQAACAAFHRRRISKVDATLNATLAGVAIAKKTLYGCSGVLVLGVCTSCVFHTHDVMLFHCGAFRTTMKKPWAVSCSRSSQENRPGAFDGWWRSQLQRGNAAGENPTPPKAIYARA